MLALSRWVSLFSLSVFVVSASPAAAEPGGIGCARPSFAGAHVLQSGAVSDALESFDSKLDRAAVPAIART